MHEVWVGDTTTGLPAENTRWGYNHREPIYRAIYRGYNPIDNW